MKQHCTLLLVVAVAISVSTNAIDYIHWVLTSSNTIVKYVMKGVEEWRKDNLVYTGKRPSVQISQWGLSKDRRVRGRRKTYI